MVEDAGVCVCVWREMHRGAGFRLRGGGVWGLGLVSGRVVEYDGLPFLVPDGCEGFWVGFRHDGGT